MTTTTWLLYHHGDLCTQMPYLTRYWLPLPCPIGCLPGLQSYATLWKDVKSGVWWVDIIYAQYTLQVLAEMQKKCTRRAPPRKVQNTCWAHTSRRAHCTNFLTLSQLYLISLLHQSCGVHPLIR